MNLKQIEKILTEAQIEPNEAKIEAKMLVRHFLKLSDIDMILNDEFEESEELIEAAQLRAEKRIPIQHIIGYAYFMKEDFIVNEHVLIPRDETEILVRKAVEIINSKKGMVNSEQKADSVNLLPASPLRVLDIGTGSGCIACMISKLTEAQVIGVDISIEALQVALDNASKLGLYNKAIFRKSDIFSNVVEKFDMIISNPPYIPLTERDSLQVEVGFEPEGALFAPDEHGIEFYERIINQADEFLNKGGYLLFELGIGQSDLVKELMEKSGFKNVEIEKDLAYIDRIVWGNK